MTLNPDCVRDVLLYLEENLGYIERKDKALEHNSISISAIADDLAPEHEYSADEVKYATEKLLEIGYILAKNVKRGANDALLYCHITDISWDGHEFLNNIRPKSVWDATKSGATKLGTMSIRALSTIAMKVTQALITHPTIINSILEQVGVGNM